MIVVDSSVWIDYFNGRETTATERLDGLLGVQLLAVGDLILAEVLQGFRNDAHYKTARELMTSLAVLEMLGERMAIRSAGNYRSLRARGVTVRKTVDVIIALPFVRHLGLRAG